MTEGEKTRLVAWSRELRAVHERLREALRVTREALDAGTSQPEATRDLLVYCRGFCAALTAHHQGEDRLLFPAIAAQHPELAEPLRRLQQDHSMIDHLVTALDEAVGRSADPAELGRHLEGVAAIMESHFRYEERTLLGLLETLELRAPVAEVLGPL